MELHTQGSSSAPPQLQTIRTLIHSELHSGELELPLLPTVAAEVLSSSLDDRADAARLAELIQTDPALASHMLKVVNSPAFRGASEIVALQQAIARLGMERIREIALSASLKGALFKPGPYQAFIEEAWQLALATGLWSKEVARACRRNVETAYLNGLLHNIGTPLIVNRVTALNGALPAADLEALIESLQQPAGVMLATEWDLPPLVARCIAHLGDFTAAAEEQDTVAIVVAGRAVAGWMCLQDLLVSNVIQLPAVQHLHLYPEDIEQLLEKQDDIRASMESMCI